LDIIQKWNSKGCFEDKKNFFREKKEEFAHGTHGIHGKRNEEGMFFCMD
jgi:hypothetical protein